jgi:hypothetical protein
MKRKLLTFAAIVVFLSAALAVAAEDLPPMYVSFLGLQRSDFQYLYPGSNYRANPAFVRQLKRPFLVLGSESYWDWESYQQQHTAGYSGSGSGNGTDTYEAHDATLPLDLEAFFPVGSGMTIGGDAGCELTPSDSTTTYTGWSSATQSTTQTQSSVGWSLYGDALFAMTIGDSLDIGVFPGYFCSSDPYSVQWSTDTSVAGGKAFIASPATSYTSTGVSTPGFAAGAVLHMAAITVGLGLSSSYRMGSRSSYVAVDEDGDGNAETIVPASDYYTTGSSWGAFGGPYTGFSNLDVDDTLVVSANPTFEWKLNDWLSIIGGGSAAFQIERKVTYMRLSTSDQSGTQIDLQTPSASLFGGVRISPAKEITLRAELGFTGTWLSQQNNSVAMSGSSIFSESNSGHYHEVSWASQPSNGAVTAVVGTSTDSYSSSKLGCEALFGFDWTPVPGVIVFSVGSIAFTSASSLYSVYNVATDSVWQETSGTSKIDLQYSLNIGTGVFVTRNVFVGVKAQEGSVGWDTRSDGTPTSSGETTSGGSGTYSDLLNYRYDGTFSLTLFCVVTL